MKDHELTSLETELKRMKPAQASKEFVEGLQEALQLEDSIASRPSPPATGRRAVPSWRHWLKWLVPAAGAAGVLTLVFLIELQRRPPAAAEAQNSTPRAIDEVELDKELVAAFEGVVQLPNGLPIRFRCYGWQEALTLRDASGAIEVQQQSPCLEVVPVGFDVY